MKPLKYFVAWTFLLFIYRINIVLNPSCTPETGIIECYFLMLIEHDIDNQNMVRLFMIVANDNHFPD